ncbi:MAG: hypothetical protein ACREUV_04140 [Burkholderiales bacterium]
MDDYSIGLLGGSIVLTLLTLYASRALLLSGRKRKSKSTRAKNHGFAQKSDALIAS